jgi:ATP-dependent exoDNAse (exonuclease V) beta subunit
MPTEKFFPTLFQHLATDTSRNLVVSAGAGAGKTAVLTRRMIKILREQRLPLDSLMVVTFTDKAAVEMTERVYADIDRKSERTGRHRGLTSLQAERLTLESVEANERLEILLFFLYLVFKVSKSIQSVIREK